MMHPYRTFIFILTALFANISPALAQKKLLTEEEDSVALFRGVSVSYDVAGTIMRMVGDYGQYEAAVKVNLKDVYFPTLELGIGDAKHEKDAVTGITAKTTAPYFRLGCDVNIAKNKHDGYRVLLGARYAMTSFKQEASGIINDGYWGGTADYNVDMRQCTVHWGEVLFGVDAKVWGPVRLGWTVRYRHQFHSSDIGNNKIWYIPGYGKSTHVLGATFNVSLLLGH